MILRMDHRIYDHRIYDHRIFGRGETKWGGVGGCGERQLSGGLFNE